MKIIGLIGGMSWESSAEYYRLINEGVRQRLGGQHNAKTLMYTVDFQEIEHMQQRAAWDEAADVLIDSARRLQAGGADFLLLCTNTMHKVAPNITQAVGIPLIHIADATAERIREAGLTRIGLLGTRFTMEQDFYKGKLINEYGLDVLIPDEADRERIHAIIYDELCQGKIIDESRADYLRIMQKLTDRGAQGIILGCTEITLLIKPHHTPIALFDTTAIHAQKAIELAL